MDASGIALKLETLIGRLDRLPLAFEAKPSGRRAARRGRPSWLKSLWADFWAEFSQLLRIERMDQPLTRRCWRRATRCSCAKPQAAPHERRLALLSRDGSTFREDVRISREWLERYFDLSNAAAAAAKADLVELQGVPVGVELPTCHPARSPCTPSRPKPEQRADVPPPRPRRPPYPCSGEEELRSLMRGLLWLIGLFALAAGLAVAGRYNEGYALLVWPPYRIQISLNL